MSTPKAMIVGPCVEPGGALIVGTWLRVEPVGPPGAVLRSSDGAILGASTVLTSDAGDFVLELATNADIDDASGVSGSTWLITAAGLQRDRNATRLSWRFRLAAGDAGVTVPMGDGRWTVADGAAPPGWHPIAGPPGPPGPAGPRGVPDPTGHVDGAVPVVASGDYDVRPLTGAEIETPEWVPLESVGLLPGERNRGRWDASTAYEPGDVVGTVAPGLFVALTASAGDDPDQSSSGAWDDIIGRGPTVALGVGADGGNAFGAATAIGSLALASGEVATAIGTVTLASGERATAIGSLANASGEGATAIGFQASADGEVAIAIGFNAVAPTDGDINIGDVYKANQVDGTAEITPGLVDLPVSASSTNPAAGKWRLVSRSGGLYVRDSAGTEVGPLGAAPDLTGIEREIVFPSNPLDVLTKLEATGAAEPDFTVSPSGIGGFTVTSAVGNTAGSRRVLYMLPGTYTDVEVAFTVQAPGRQTIATKLPQFGVALRASKTGSTWGAWTSTVDVFYAYGVMHNCVWNWPDTADSLRLDTGDSTWTAQARRMHVTYVQGISGNVALGVDHLVDLGSSIDISHTGIFDGTDIPVVGMFDNSAYGVTGPFVAVGDGTGPEFVAQPVANGLIEAPFDADGWRSAKSMFPLHIVARVVGDTVQYRSWADNNLDQGWTSHDHASQRTITSVSDADGAMYLPSEGQVGFWVNHLANATGQLTIDNVKVRPL